MRLHLFRALVVSAVLCLFTSSAFAAESVPATDAQIDELLRLVRAKDTISAMLPQIEASQKVMIAQMADGQRMTPTQRARFQAIMEKFSSRTREALAWEKMQPMYRDLYRKTFDSEDMNTMIGFYGSPAGQKLLDKMPLLMKNMMANMQKMLVPLIDGMRKDIDSELADPAKPKPAAERG